MTRLIERLPAVRGRYVEAAPLGPMTWFRTGGAAEVLFHPADAEDLAEFMAARPADVPLTTIGAGSNMIVRDGGVPGVVIKLGRPLARIEIVADGVRAGAGALDVTVSLRARDAGLTGLEFLSGIPGTIGGALRMNAGAYGSEIADVFVEAEALDPLGRRRRLAQGDMGFTYRHAAVPEDWVFLAATLRAERGDPAGIAQAMEDIRRAREASQPTVVRTGGSTFANPPGEKAWQLIERAGCRGLRVGGAVVSTLHCNFLVNEGGASAADIEALGEEVRRRVHAASGIALEWEIRRIGVPLGLPVRPAAPGETP